MANEDIIAVLRAEREQILQRAAAIEMALDLLGTDGGPLPTTSNGRPPQVGADKLDAIRDYLRRQTEPARQASITHGTGMNSGTVSNGLKLLKQRGEVEEGPKQDRSKTWRLASR